jgi:hypothetical protein
MRSLTKSLADLRNDMRKDLVTLVEQHAVGGVGAKGPVGVRSDSWDKRWALAHPPLAHLLLRLPRRRLLVERCYGFAGAIGCRWSYSRAPWHGRLCARSYMDCR